MKRTIPPGYAALLLLGGVCCGGNTAPATSPDASSNHGDAGGLDAGGPDAAHDGGSIEHRATATPCAPTPLPLDPVIPDAGLVPGASFACHVNADCTQGARGRCVLYQSTAGPSGIAGSQCEYDQCHMDSDCAGGGVCSCDGDTCLAGNCRVDSDCSSGELCSPNRDPCSSPPNAVVGYFCHSSADQCTSNSDCDPTKSEPYCVFDMTVDHWTCPQNAGCPQ